MNNGIYIPLGPVDDFPVIDDFTYEEVRESHCIAAVSQEISRFLIEKAEMEGKKYMTVCIPAYNEDFLELLKTLTSLMENFEFMQKKARLHDDTAGKSLKSEFLNTIPVIVPIFDGVKALSKTMREWITCNFPLLLNELDGPSEPGKIDVRVSCSKWWYFCEDTLPEEPGIPSSQAHTLAPKVNPGAPDSELLQRVAQNHKMLNPDGTYRGLGHGHDNKDHSFEDDDKILYFYMCPIVKRLNHRKHNSHQWFFDSICEGLQDKVSFAFLTDCGTSYEPTCISRLLYELFFKPDLIGATARQRVETPNIYFHPCEDTPFWCFQNSHEGGDQTPCWKCWAAFCMSPCPLQGFEFEATLILNSAMFNLVEALPVMPGPCQLLNWQKMKEFKVVDEYFNLLFEGEAERKLPTLPKSLKRMRSSKMEPTTVEASEALDAASFGKISFTEFLRVNMRLAEDRILSFVSVFSTGYGTKWVPGATFFYQPEVCWQSLLTQRRRWLNGTFASFLFFFMSQRARTRIHGGLFDAHKAGKNIRFVNALWSLQLMQLILVLIAPAVFGSAGYVGVLESGTKWPAAFGWSHYILFENLTIGEFWTGAYLGIYAIWTLWSYYADRGKMSETACMIIALLGFAYMFPVYFAVWYSIVTVGPDIVGGLVIAGLLVPVFIAIAESFACAALYLLYLPWFMVLIVFFLVFVPAYSFARLWDTTWGNRATGKDSAINDSVEKTMKFRNFIFSNCLVLGNIGLTWAFIKMFMLGYNVVIAFMFIVFCPVIVQMICSFVFLFIVLPLRNFYSRPLEDGLAVTPNNFGRSNDGDMDMDDNRSVNSRSKSPRYADGQKQLYSPSNDVNNTSGFGGDYNNNTPLDSANLENIEYRLSAV